jgi:hypothetical protein
VYNNPEKTNFDDVFSNQITSDKRIFLFPDDVSATSSRSTVDLGLVMIYYPINILVLITESDLSLLFLAYVPKLII